jgi:UDP-GlcNAc:undecaprenyl-phosphate GlcNAc-1-phosphate transferase
LSYSQLTSIFSGGVLAAALCFIGVPILTRLGTRWGFLDYPGGRKHHHQPVSFLGGLVVCLSINIALLTTGLSFLSLPPMIILLADLIFLLGFWDDLCSLSPWLRLVVQILIGLCTVWAGIKVHFISIPGGGMNALGWMGAPLTIIWLVALVNMINLIDGLDGLAGGITLIASGSLCFVGIGFGQWTAVWLCLVLAGAMVGFLPYNLYPARVFLGNGGAYFLGYLLAVASVQGALKSPVVLALAIPVMALGIPFLDILWAMVRRLRLGMPLMGPDRSHLHHLLVAQGWSHRQAVYILLGISAFLGLVSIFLSRSSWEWGCFLMVVIGGVGFVWVRRLYANQMAATVQEESMKQ